MIRTQLVGVFNHLEQGLFLFLSVYGPAGIKNFMATMLRICLCEHV